MWNERLAALRRLTDPELVERVQQLAAGERGALVSLAAHLAELDTRDVHLRAGHGSLFAYCRDVLALSEQDAYSHIVVARAARRFPSILSLLEQGAVNVTSIRLLAPHLTADNHQEVLEAARGKNKLQVEEIAARLWPRPDASASIRKLPEPKPAAHPAALAPSAGPGGSPPNGSYPPPFLERPSAGVTPLAPDRYRVQVTIGGDTLEKLRLAKDLLRHAVPSGDAAVILDRALTALLSDLAHRKFAASQAPRPFRGAAPGSRHIPAEVKRAVWLRDLGRCGFVGANGRRCAERGFLEFHHIRPFALGGEATAANIQMRCRAHNDYEARVCFGLGRGEGVREGAPRYGGGADLP
jgi:hypothetical protein